jgi:hypothetical protein
MISSPVYERTAAARHFPVIDSIESLLPDLQISRLRKRHTMHTGVAQKAVTCDAWLYANAEAALRPAPSDAMTYDGIYTGIERQQAWLPLDPTERDGERTPWSCAWSEDRGELHLARLGRSKGTGKKKQTNRL